MQMFRLMPVAGTFFLMILVSACDKSGPVTAMPAPPPPQVSVITLKSGDVPMERVLPGRLEPSRIAEVRARVDGIVEKRAFIEGSDVKAGQLLFQIDPAPYQAKYAAAQAQLAKVQADIEDAGYQAKRYRQLLESKSVSESDVVRVESRFKQSQAELLAARAAVDSARIALDYSQVTAPIAGRIGRGLVTEGALVSQLQSTPLAIIQQTNPMEVTFNQDVSELLDVYKARSDGKLVNRDNNQKIEVHVILSNGSEYPLGGTLLFSDITVDNTTSQIKLRAEIPNPEGLLLPGMFVRVKFQQASYSNAFIIPQQALMRNEQGDNVYIVGADNVLNVRPVKVVGSINKQWLINEGLQDGEQLMVEGFQKSRPGSPVNPVHWANNPDNAKPDTAAVVK